MATFPQFHPHLTDPLPSDRQIKRILRGILGNRGIAVFIAIAVGVTALAWFLSLAYFASSQGILAPIPTDVEITAPREHPRP